MEPTKPDSEQPEVLSTEDQKKVEGIRLVGLALLDRTNNNTTSAVALIDMLQNKGLIPDNLRAIADAAMTGLDNLTKDISMVAGTRRIVTQASPMGPMLNLESSSAPKPPSAPPPKP